MLLHQIRVIFLNRYLFVISILTCGSCSYLPSERSYPTTKQVDTTSIPDATPKAEVRSKYGNPKSYVVAGKRYHVIDDNRGFEQEGLASWYGKQFHGKRTSSGEIYDMYAMTAAHKTLILPVYLEVTNLKNNKQVVVKVNDRGPFHENRIVDLSYVAARKLGIVETGTARVKIRVTESAKPAHHVFKREKAPVSSISSSGTSTTQSQFFIQVGAFSQLSNAQGLSRKLNFVSSDLVNIEEAVVANKQLYRVRIGPLSNTSGNADKIIKQLIQLDEYEHHIIFPYLP